MIDSIAGQVAFVPIVGQLVELLPESARRVVTSLPNPASTKGLIFYGAWGVSGLAVAKKLVGRFRSGSSGPAPTVEQDSSAVRSGGTAVGKTQQSSAGKSNVAFTLPAILPLSKGIRSVTHHEIHAIELGLVVGVTTAWLLSIGRRNVAVTITVAFVAGALGYKRYKSKAFKTIRMEPWYGLLAFGSGSIVGIVVFAPQLLRSTLGV